ncbi:anti-sigma factor family protein [Thalassobaculum litoreum]|uniref:Transmembrane transcriptional regulator (Anti-sigma factor RsiW) n=1 Tax=Thalassobaculum litoreum DSM 18839 TaxID=1123362 RepID=A0A8G2BJ52_9PROT|nr:hypothetical protein [Thalassobaculum litoreum]SDF92883.1 hypothetical protein SAMN05660686_02761 [Thalassobaculum litoreum DSM 18839]
MSTRNGNGTNGSGSIEDWEVGAYVDDELSPQRRREIAAAAGASPELAARIEVYTRHKSLLAGLASRPVDDEIPEQMRAAATRLSRATTVHGWMRRGRQVMVAQARIAAVLVIGAVVGWTAQEILAPRPGNATDGPLAFIDEATEAHRTLALAPMFATDVGSVDFAKLSEMFSEGIDPAGLRANGLILSKVDMASTDQGPAVQFLFFDREARPVSLLLSVNSASLHSVGVPDGEMVVTSYNDFAVAFGRRDSIAFVVTAALPERRVGEIARQLVASAGF